MNGCVEKLYIQAEGILVSGDDIRLQLSDVFVKLSAVIHMWWEEMADRFEDIAKQAKRSSLCDPCSGDNWSNSDLRTRFGVFNKW